MRRREMPMAQTDLVSIAFPLNALHQDIGLTIFDAESLPIYYTEAKRPL